MLLALFIFQLSRRVPLGRAIFFCHGARNSLVARTKFSHFPILLWGSSRLGLAIRMGLFSAASNSLLPLMDKVFFPAVPARPTRWFKILEIFFFSNGCPTGRPFCVFETEPNACGFSPFKFEPHFSLGKFDLYLRGEAKFRSVGPNASKERKLATFPELGFMQTHPQVWQQGLSSNLLLHNSTFLHLLPKRDREILTVRFSPISCKSEPSSGHQ